MRKISFALISYLEMMKVNISFRVATPTDKAFLLELRKLSMSEHLVNAGIVMTDEQHMARINEHFNDSTIIICDGENCGLIKLGLFINSIHIRQFQMLPQFQGKGIGAEVLRIVKRKAAQKHLPVTLNVLHKNPAKFLYLRQGFIVVSENDLEYAMLCPTTECQKLL